MDRTDEVGDDRTDAPGAPAGDCTTTRSFVDHDIADGADLVKRTYYRLRDDGAAYEPTERFFDRLETAFVRAYLDSAAEPTLPEHVRAAVDDARALTESGFEGRADADLRTDVLPAFYRHVAGFHCRYRVAAAGTD